MRFGARTRALVLGLATGLAAPLSGGQDPPVDAPPPEIPASIVCIPRDTEATGVGGGHSILYLGVRNPLERAAEPLSFRLVLPGPPERELVVARVPLPHVGRRGRPVAPGAREEYALAIPRPAAALRGVTVAVETMVLFDGAPAAIEPPRVYGISARQGRDVVRLENPAPQPLDLVLEVTYGAERRRSLHTVRLAAGESFTWDVPPPTGWNPDDGARPPRALDVRAVDACALEPAAGSDERARKRLLRACAGWIAERTIADGAVGLFELDHNSGGRPLHLQGRFEVVGDGFAVEPLGGWDRPRDAQVVGEALEALFQLRERLTPLEDVVDRAAPRLQAESATETVLGLETLPALGVDAPALVGLRADRIAWISGPALGEPPWRRWWTRPFGTGYVRFGVDLYEELALEPLRPNLVTRWSFEAEPGPRGNRFPRPVEFRRKDLDERGKFQTATRLAVSFLGAGNRPATSDPADDAGDGEALAALREAWERPLRYAGPESWRARCEWIAPAPREAWGGRDWVSGSVVVEGLRAGGWIRATFAPVGAVDARRVRREEGDAPVEDSAGEPEEGAVPRRRLPAEPLTGAQRREIAEGLEERLGAWTRLDFAHRPPFELLFAGARVQRRGADLVIEGSPIRRVRLRDGLPVQVTEADGTRTDIEYLSLPEADLPVRIQRRGRQLGVQHLLVGDRWLPRRLVLVDFPPDGGLETLLFEDWRAR